MNQRKKWTPQENITDAGLKARERKKWQLAFRRYVVEKKASPDYALYFGLRIEDVRRWIEIQFTDGLTWDNFGTHWQFEHLLPLSYFDFSREDDLRLCWNFTNITVVRLTGDHSKIDLLAAKSHFQHLFERTGYKICEAMVARIQQFETLRLPSLAQLEHFMLDKQAELQKTISFSMEEFNRLNQGTSLDDIILEREILSKFG